MTLDPRPSDAELLAMASARRAHLDGPSITSTPLNRLAEAKIAVRIDAKQGKLSTPIVWPVYLVIPWSLLISDNDKYGVLDGRIVLKREYREAKRCIKQRAQHVVGHHVELAHQPLRLLAQVYVPDNRVHDIANCAKLVHDGLEGAIYVNDRWLSDVHWLKAGVDCDAPRAEITIHPLTLSPSETK